MAGCWPIRPRRPPVTRRPMICRPATSSPPIGRTQPGPSAAYPENRRTRARRPAADTTRSRPGGRSPIKTRRRRACPAQRIAGYHRSDGRRRWHPSRDLPHGVKFSDRRSIISRKRPQRRGICLKKMKNLEDRPAHAASRFRNTTSRNTNCRARPRPARRGGDWQRTWRVSLRSDQRS